MNDETFAERAGQPAGSLSTSSPGGGWLGRLRERLGFQDGPTARDVMEKALAEESRGTSVFAPEQREMLRRILRFGELRVLDVMVPRADIIAIDESESLSALLRIFQQAGHSRVPLFHETLDDLRGMVHIKDLLGWIVEEAGGALPQGAGETVALPEALVGIDLAKVGLDRAINTTRIRRPVLFVPPSMPALNLLLRMQSTRVHLAMVIDEYGGTFGLVSIEDLVEQIVGEIEDEHDDEEDEEIVRDQAGGLTVAARTSIADVEAELGVSLITDPDRSEDYDTLGGLLVALAGRVPVRGELVHHPAGFEFEVLDADPRRLKKLRVHRTVEGGKPMLALPPPAAGPKAD